MEGHWDLGLDRYGLGSKIDKNIAACNGGVACKVIRICAYTDKHMAPSTAADASKSIGLLAFPTRDMAQPLPNTFHPATDGALRTKMSL